MTSLQRALWLEIAADLRWARAVRRLRLLQMRGHSAYASAGGMPRRLTRRRPAGATQEPT